MALGVPIRFVRGAVHLCPRYQRRVGVGVGWGLQLLRFEFQFQQQLIGWWWFQWWGWGVGELVSLPRKLGGLVGNPALEAEARVEQFHTFEACLP